MASAGATFVVDGAGNVDHLSWVPMTADGPKIANIALKGIFDRKGLDPKMLGAYDPAPVAGHGHSAAGNASSVTQRCEAFFISRFGDSHGFVGARKDRG